MRSFFLIPLLILGQIMINSYNISSTGEQIILHQNNESSFVDLPYFFEDIQKQNNNNSFLEIQVFSDLVVNDTILWYQNIKFYSSSEGRNNINFMGAGTIKSTEKISFIIQNFDFKKDNSFTIESLFDFQNSILGTFKVLILNIFLN